MHDQHIEERARMLERGSTAEGDDRVQRVVLIQVLTLYPTTCGSPNSSARSPPGPRSLPRATATSAPCAS